MVKKPYKKGKQAKCIFYCKLLRHTATVVFIKSKAFISSLLLFLIMPILFQFYLFYSKYSYSILNPTSCHRNNTIYNELVNDRNRKSVV